jgi:hypothetical protein
MAKYVALSLSIFTHILEHFPTVEVKIDTKVVSALVPIEIAYELNENLWETFMAPDIRLGTTPKVGHLLFVIVEREEK